MNSIVKIFIENNIEYIDEGMYDELYDEAYEWLSESQSEELTKILTEVIDVKVEVYAKENILKHLHVELQNFVSEKQRVLTLATFVRMYMNHINGIDWDEFQLLVEQELKNSKLVTTYYDGEGNLFIHRRNQ